jgi:hypothetical protein
LTPACGHRGQDAAGVRAAGFAAQAMAASRMPPAAMPGCDFMTKWEATSTSVTVEPARSQEKRWSSGATGRSAVPNTAQDGFARQPAGGGIVERRARHRALRDRHERRVAGRKVGAEDVVEPRGVDRDLNAAVGQRRRAHKRAHREQREASLEVVDRLALVRHEASDLYEPGDLVRATGDRDHNTAVRIGPRARRGRRPGRRGPPGRNCRRGPRAGGSAAREGSDRRCGAGQTRAASLTRPKTRHGRHGGRGDQLRVRQFGIGGCEGRMTQEFGDHPDATAERMRWAPARRLAAGRR